ncbi:site-2 protease family protein [Candidatus Woesearchaeota archaeon]|nr:site-2 protease family protein [Candidatus Woesearchaeota archaeon]
MILYRTKIGLLLMDKIAKKHSKLVSAFAYFSIAAGFAGMATILILLVNGTYNFLFAGAPPPVAPLFPGVRTVPGLPELSFFHWIIAIFILAGVHEFSHGLIARLHDIKVKSSGFAVFSFLLPVIPAAFVEPDEKELASKKSREQLGVLGAGSASNLITAGVFFMLFILVMAPIVSSITISEGVVIRGINEGSPASNAGIGTDEKILSINNVDVRNIEDFIEFLSGIKPGDTLQLETDKRVYNLEAGENNGKGYLGLSFSPERQYIDNKSGFFGKFISWTALLFFWIFAANLGVGLFNLLPMGPLDGGKMFYLLCLKVFKKENIAKKIWISASLFCLMLIVISLAPFFGKLASFVFGIFTGLF